MIYSHAGIALSPEKQVMLCSRLSKRLDFYGLSSFAQYYDLIHSLEYQQEFQIMIDLVTTNETYFFREPKHFGFLKDHILKNWLGDTFKIWSAACSTGEETYSLAMVLAETLGYRKWEIFGSDISSRVLETAKTAVYLMDRLENMDNSLMEKYCLRGVRSQSGYFCMDSGLKKRIQFEQINLVKPLPTHLNRNFDVIFLRNVLIYFDQATKKSVVERVIATLKPGGYFIISHSENLHQINTNLLMIKPSIYQKKTAHTTQSSK